jgi:hypothetical protein
VASDDDEGVKAVLLQVYERVASDDEGARATADSVHPLLPTLCFPDLDIRRSDTVVHEKLEGVMTIKVEHGSKPRRERLSMM